MQSRQLARMRFGLHRAGPRALEKRAEYPIFFTEEKSSADFSEK
jgi:hypothetical protein